MASTISPFYSSLKKSLLLLGILMVSGWGNFLTAQKTIESIEVYAAEEGLSGRIITDILRDSRGLLWLGTTNGLNIFDGYSFTHYLNAPQAARKINDHYIVDLEELKHQRIAIRYQFNLDFIDVYDFKEGQTHKVLLNEANGIRGKVRDMAFRALGECWVISDDKDQLYLQKLKPDWTFEQLNPLALPASAPESKYRLLPTRQGQIWIADDQKGLFLLDSLGTLRRHVSTASIPTSQENLYFPQSVRIFHEDQSGRIWLGFDNRPGIYICSPGDTLFQQYTQMPTDRPYFNLWEDGAGNLIFSIRQVFTTVEEILCLKKNGEVKNLQHLVEQEPLTICLFAENIEDYLFLGTYNGLYRIKYHDDRIHNYLDTVAGVWGKTIKGITGDRAGRIFMAKETEWWYQLTKSNHHIDTLWVIDPQNGQAITLRNSTQLIYDDNHLWGTHWDTTRREGVLIKMDLATRRSRFFRYPQEIRSIAEGENGQIWLAQGSPGETGKLTRFDRKTEQFSDELDFAQTDLEALADPCYLLKSKTGVLWIGTSKGLLVYRPSDGNTQVYTVDDDATYSLSNDQIIHIHESEDGLLYLGTFGGGINIFDPQTGNIVVKDESQGLANNDVCGILPDDRGNFWVSTFNGLSYWDRENDIFRNFFIKDGLSHNEFNRYAFYQDETNTYYFGNLNGVSTFNTDELIPEDRNLPLCLTRLAVYDSRKDQLEERYNGLQDLSEMVLSPYASYFELNFTLPDYDEPQKHQYSVRLGGLEKKWTYLSGRPPYVRYNTLKAGNYVLHLRGTTSDGNPVASTKQIKIIVEQVYYKTWQFLTLLGLCLLAIGYALYRYRLRQVIAVERLRTQIASDLHDEVGSIMTRISMGSELLREGLYSEEEQQEELEKIANQSRAVTSIMRDVIWSIDARQDRVKNLLDRIQDQLEELLPLAEIEFSLEVVGMLPEKELEITVRQNIYFIFKEAINNIVRHAQASKVVVSLRHHPYEGFELKIADNGKGRSNNQNKSGQGLKNMEMRAKRMEAQLELIDENGFTVRLRRKPLW